MMWFALENMESEVQRALDTYELTACHCCHPGPSHSSARQEQEQPQKQLDCVYGMDVSLSLDWISLINSPTYMYLRQQKQQQMNKRIR